MQLASATSVRAATSIVPPLRVAYVISTLDAGGAERQLLELVNSLPEHVEPFVFVLRSRLRLRQQLNNPRAKLRVIGLRAWLDLPRWLDLWRELRRARPDAIHSHMPLSNFAARVLRAGSGAAVLLNHEHGISMWTGRSLNLFDHLSQSLADTIIVVSDASRVSRMQHARLDPERLVVMPNALDWKRWSTLAPAPADRPAATWGVAARLVPIKRVELALDVFAAVRQRGGQQRLLIAGDGPERGRLEQRCRALGLLGAVSFLGELRDMRVFYTQVDVVLLTSWNEDCPLVILEALATGKFVVATAVGGIPELLTDAPHAHLMKDTERLEDVALALGGIAPGHDSLENREYARKFDIRAYVQRLLSLYQPLERGPGNEVGAGLQDALRGST